MDRQRARDSTDSAAGLFYEESDPNFDAFLAAQPPPAPVVADRVEDDEPDGLFNDDDDDDDARVLPARKDVSGVLIVEWLDAIIKFDRVGGLLWLWRWLPPRAGESSSGALTRTELRRASALCTK